MGSGYVHLDDVSCVGSASHITQCNYSIVSSLNISHQQDVGVQCQQGMYIYRPFLHWEPCCDIKKLFLIGDEVKEGDIRIGIYGEAWTGIVDIYLSGVWGTVYYYGASSEEAWVACRQLGYHTYGI